MNAAGSYEERALRRLLEKLQLPRRPQQIEFEQSLDKGMTIILDGVEYPMTDEEIMRGPANSVSFPTAPLDVEGTNIVRDEDSR